MHVLEQAVLHPVGRHEHHAGDIPRLLVHQPLHGCGAALGDALDVGQQVERPVAEGRPGAAVDRPAECGADLGRMAEGAALRDHAAGDGDADDLGRRIGQRHVHQQRRPVGVRQALRPGGREDGSPRDRHPPVRTRAVLEDVEDSVPGRVAAGQKRGPGRPGVGGQARAGHAPAAAADQRGEVGEVALLEQRIEDVPVGAVPADDECAGRHRGDATRGAGGGTTGGSCIFSHRCRIIMQMVVAAPHALATAGIAGSTGYAGRELQRLLAAHPRLRGTACTADTRALAQCDLAFLALPHGASSELGRELAGARVPVVDLSADMRFEWTYGLPELHRDAIATIGGRREPGLLRHRRDARPGTAGVRGGRSTRTWSSTASPASPVRAKG